VNTASDWTLDPDRLSESLAHWYSQEPSGRQLVFVQEFLMDLIDLGPFACGEEDDDTGIFTGVASDEGIHIVIVYVPDLSQKRIAVIDISSS
jgi:hypothetical protein